MLTHLGAAVDTFLLDLSFTLDSLLLETAEPEAFNAPLTSEILIRKITKNEHIFPNSIFTFFFDFPGLAQ